MKFLEQYDLQILETLIIIAVLGVINFAMRKWSYRIAQKFKLGLERRRITTKIVNLLLTLIGFVSLMGVWGVNQEQLFVFLTSVLTVLGVGFFATWSILSNITSGLLLYFNHPLHIGDYVTIIDKETPVEGVIKDISMFFMHIETPKGEKITIPNSVVTQKTISIRPMSELQQKMNFDIEEKSSVEVGQN